MLPTKPIIVKSTFIVQKRLPKSFIQLGLDNQLVLVLEQSIKQKTIKSTTKKKGVLIRKIFKTRLFSFLKEYTSSLISTQYKDSIVTTLNP